jgi:outer membrane biosynthesis protein TonB
MVTPPPQYLTTAKIKADNHFPVKGARTHTLLNMDNRFYKKDAEDGAPGTGKLKMNRKELTDPENPDLEGAVQRLTEMGWDLARTPFEVKTLTDKKGETYTALVPKGETPTDVPATEETTTPTEDEPETANPLKPKRKRTAKKASVPEDKEEPAEKAD